jgi:capsular polysaccharide export protein
MSVPNHDGSSLVISWCDSGLWRQRSLIEGFLDAPLYRDFAARRRKGAIRIGWGLKKSGLRARSIGAATSRPVWLLEDGFLRSRRLGHLDLPLSIVVDDVGIYYDCSRPSRLENLIADSLSLDQEAQAQGIIAAWREMRVSKYNFQPEYAGDLPGYYILVVDQTKEDHSILYGGADKGAFALMLRAALNENSGCEVLVKTHPDVLAGRRPGHFGEEITRLSSRIHLIADPVHPVRLIEHAAAVYTVTSQMGFEALIWGRRVRTFGTPFYAGWGLTEDDSRVSNSRRTRASITQLVHASLLGYTCYNKNDMGTDISDTVDGFQSLARECSAGRLTPGGESPTRNSL